MDPAVSKDSAWRRWLRRLLRCILIYYTAAMLSVLITVYIFLLEPLRLTVEEVPVEMRGWAADAAPARVVVLADIHAGEHDGWRMSRIVKLTLELQPELVLLAGDYFNGIHSERAMSAEKIAAYLAPLAQRCPVFYVYGNHDQGDQSKYVSKAFKNVGFKNIHYTENVITFNNGQKLKLRGTPHRDEPKPGAKANLAPWLEARFSKEKLPADMPLLALSHNPYYFLHHNLWADLAVAGHTHGGQVCWPGGTPLVADSPWTPATACAGMKKGKNDGLVYTSRGLGLSRLPVRLCCPPEITVLLLVPATGSE